MISEKIDKLRNRWIKYLYYWKRKFIFFYRILTSRLRLLPDFIIIGGPRCGSTSLYNYLIRNPFIGTALRKEVSFFDENFTKSIIWYRAFFPLKALKFLTKYIFRHRFITGEASPFYIFDTETPNRIFSILPKVKLIILLRNPVHRAYSQYQNFKLKLKKKGINYISFKEAIKKDKAILHGKTDDIFKDNINYNNSILGLMASRHYLARGIYADQIRRWRKYFPEEQILILNTEEFNENPVKILKKVYKFLNFPYWTLKDYKSHNVRRYPKIDNEIKKYLIEFYKPHNQRLYKFLGRSFNWDV